MLTALATFLGLKRSLVTGLAVAALLVAFGPQFKKLGQQQETMAQQTIAAPQQSTAAPQTAAQPSPPKEDLPQGNSPQSTLQENLKVLELDEEGFNWRKDWWKYAIMALTVILLAYFTLKVTNLLLRTAIVTLCIVFGLIGSLILSPVIAPYLAQLLDGKLPSFLEPVYIAYALCFLVCYLLATALTNAVGSPRKKKNDTKA